MSVETTFTLDDRMSAALDRIIAQTERMVTTMERADNAIQNNGRNMQSSANAQNRAQRDITAGLDLTEEARARLIRSAENGARRIAMAQAREADAQRQLAEASRQQASVEEAAQRRRGSLNDQLQRSQARLISSREAEAEAIRRVTATAQSSAAEQARAQQALIQARRNVQQNIETQRQAQERLTRSATQGATEQARALERVRQAQAQLDEARRRGALTEQAAANVGERARQRAIADTARVRAEQARMQGELNRAAAAQEALNQRIREGENATRALGQRIIGMVAMFASFHVLKDLISSFVQMSDIVSNTTARINMMNDGLQTTKAMQDDIFAAAQRSRTEYSAMSDVVAKLGVRASSAFANSGEVLQFAENLNKQFVIAGASTAEINSASLQLTQALGSGVLRGEELNAVFEAAPNVIQTIADHLDVPIGKIRSMASDGEITADIVRTAMLEATDDINKQFDSMPKTFGQAMVMIKNDGVKTLEPLFERFAHFVNGEAFKTLAHVATAVFARIAVALDVLLQAFILFSNVVAWVANIFIKNWSFIAPILTVIGAVMGTITAILIVKYTWLGLVRVATLAWAAAQWVVNKAYLTNPITWVILAVVAAIALVIYALLKWQETTAQVVGVVAGSFMYVGAVIVNIFIGIANTAIAVAEWIINAWNMMGYGLSMMWYEMSQFVLRVLDWIIDAAYTVAEWIINTWNLMIYGLQVAWYELSQFVLRVLDWIIDAAFTVAEFIVNTWNLMIFGLQMMWYELSQFVLRILDSIVEAGFKAADFFLNLWNNATFAVQNSFYKMADMALGAIETLAGGTAGVVDAMLDGIMKAVNKAVGLLNVVIDAANKIPGVNIGHIGEMGGGGGGIGAVISSMRGNLKAPTKATSTALTRPDKLAGKAEMPTEPGKVSFARPPALAGKGEAPTKPGEVSLGRPPALAGKGEAPTEPSQVVLDRFDYKDPTEAFEKGKEWGESTTNKVAEGLQDMLDRIDGLTAPPSQEDNYGSGDIDYGGGPGAAAADKDGNGAGGKGAGGKGTGGKGTGGKGKNPTGGKLDSVGKIEDDINISDEDLKMLTEYADRKNIQNFITLQPNVVFDGTVVREEADLKKIVGHIETVMADEIEKSAKGVYFA